MGSEEEDMDPDTDPGVLEAGRPLKNVVDFCSLDSITETCKGAGGHAAGGRKASVFTERAELPPPEAAAGSCGPHLGIELLLDKVEESQDVVVKSL